MALCDAKSRPRWQYDDDGARKWIYDANLFVVEGHLLHFSLSLSRGRPVRKSVVNGFTRVAEGGDGQTDCLKV